MLLFFATIGASSGSISSLGSSGPLLLFIGIMTGVHWLVLGVVGKLLGLPPRVLVLGSNANIGGPATAAGEGRTGVARVLEGQKQSKLHTVLAKDNSGIACRF